MDYDEQRADNSLMAVMHNMVVSIRIRGRVAGLIWEQ